MDFPKLSAEPTLEIDEEDAGHHRATQAALFLVILTIPILVISILTARLGEGSLADCTALTDDESRLACYDHYACRVGGHPAKGAGAPYSSNGLPFGFVSRLLAQRQLWKSSNSHGGVYGENSFKGE